MGVGTEQPREFIHVETQHLASLHKQRDAV